MVSGSTAGNGCSTKEGQRANGSWIGSPSASIDGPQRRVPSLWATAIRSSSIRATGRGRGRTSWPESWGGARAPGAELRPLTAAEDRLERACVDDVGRHRPAPPRGPDGELHVAEP